MNDEKHATDEVVRSWSDKELDRRIRNALAELKSSREYFDYLTREFERRVNHR